MWSLFALLLVWITGCSFGGRPVPESGAPAYVPPTWRERQIAFRQTWDRLLSERTEREAQAMRDQEVEAREDALRQLPFVSLAACGHTTLAEAITLLLTGTPCHIPRYHLLLELLRKHVCCTETAQVEIKR